MSFNAGIRNVYPGFTSVTWTTTVETTATKVAALALEVHMSSISGNEIIRYFD